MRPLAALVLVVLVACSAAPVLAPRDCTPGQSVVCACPGGTGAQACGADGTLGACVCPDAGASDASAVDTPAPFDRVTPDVVDAAPTVDAGEPGDVVDVATDSGRWAEPDVVCGRDETRCAGGSALTPSYCADLRGDPLNCGGCGRRCQPVRPDTMMAVCFAASCQSECMTGLIDCDGDLANGCERRLSETDCRRCGNRCPPRLTCDLNGRCVPSDV